MAKLEYARRMTESEWLKIVSYRNKKYDTKKDSEQLILKQNLTSLLEQYHHTEKTYLLVSSETKKEYHKAELIQQSKKCICGCELQFIDSFGFWGCKNYKDTSIAHKNYEGKEIFIWEKPILKQYLTDIIATIGLKGKLSSKQLLAFYNENDLPDLQEKYKQGSSSDLINRYQNVKRIATDFENKTETYLRGIFAVVQPQFKVIYKYEGEKESHCILDFLCSDNTAVFIYECKTSRYDCDEKQRALYLDVIQKIIDTLKIDKDLYFRYSIQNGESEGVWQR